MSAVTCVQCATPRNVAKAIACPRCGMPYAREASAEDDHYTLHRSAAPSPQPSISEQKRAAPANFLAPPLSQAGRRPGAAERQPGVSSVRAVPPEDVQVRLPLPPPVEPRVGAHARPVPPSAGSHSLMRSSAPTVLLTILFGMLGAVAAAIQTSSARGRGLETRRYWKAFGITMLVSVLFWILLLVALFSWLSSQASTY